MKMRKRFWYDETEKTIRGSFINIVISTVYMILIIIGSFVSQTAANLKEMETLLIGFFVVSFGLWTGKKSVEFMKNNSIEALLSKHGINLGDLPDVSEALKSYRANGTSAKVDDSKNGSSEEDKR